MRRREFITLLGGAVAWPLTARAQQNEHMRHIGVLIPLAVDDREAKTRIAAFMRELAQFGWTDGRNVRIDTRWGAVDAESRQRLAKELVALQPDVIFTQNTPTTASIMQQTRTIPVVFVGVSDPIGSGFVASFPRPGGNITGFITMEATIAGKWLELLKEIAPRVNSVAFLFNPVAAPYFEYYLNPFKASAASFGIEAITAPARDVSELEAVIAVQARAPNTGLIAMPDLFLNTNRELIIRLAALNRLPAVYSDRIFVNASGLISYGPDRVDQHRQAARYVDRILRGENSADLPVQAPTKYELSINLKTAKALGLTVPPSLLARADEVIE